MRKLLFIIVVVFAPSLSAQDVAVLSQPNIFRPAQRFSHSIVLDCRVLAPTMSGEPLSVTGKARIACDSASNALKASINGGAFAALGGAGVSLTTDNVWTGANTIAATVDTSSDTYVGALTVTNASTENFTAAIAAVASGEFSYGVRAVGRSAGVFGESVSGDVFGQGGFFVAHSTGDSTAGVSAQSLEDSVNATFGGAFGNGGSHATNYGLSSFAVGGPAAWLLGASTNTQPTLLIREGFGAQDASVPMIAVDDDSDARNFSVRASGTIVHNGGVVDIVATGAPAGACVTGSMYRRTDGTAGATLYVCEATAWAAK